MKLDASAQKVLDAINVEELIKITLDLGNIDSPTGSQLRMTASGVLKL